MCGRIVTKSTPEELQEAFRLTTIVAGPERANFNVPPSLEIPAVVNDGNRALDVLRWGLVPSWTKDLKGAPMLNNARAEGIAEKRTFKSALEKRRCAILVDAFYEWRREGKSKTPFLIRRKDGKPLAFAGLWDQWQSPEHQLLRSCTVITCAANAVMAPIHDRMPVILEGAAFDTWLDPAPKPAGSLLPLLVPCPPEWLEAYPVSPSVNSVKNNGPELLAPFSGTVVLADGDATAALRPS